MLCALKVCPNNSNPKPKPARVSGYICLGAQYSARSDMSEESVWQLMVITL